jgi:hypothetical protein
MPASVVLGSQTSSTYPRGYASGVCSPAASLSEHFEQPAGGLPQSSLEELEASSHAWEESSLDAQPTSAVDETGW